jgi:hypothetical protein
MSPEPAKSILDDLCAAAPTDADESEDCVRYCWDTCAMLAQVLELLKLRRVGQAKKILREAIGRCMPDGYGEL